MKLEIGRTEMEILTFDVNQNFHTLHIPPRYLR